MVVRGGSGGDGCGYVLPASEEVDDGVVKGGTQVWRVQGGINGMDGWVGDDCRGG